MGNVSSYSQLMDIAKNAYGSGVFEGAKGGNGYVGQYTDIEGQTHVVKVLTHRGERSDYAKGAGRDGTEELARATEQLKANLIALAGGEETQLGGEIKAMLEAAQRKAVEDKMTAQGEDGQVGLLSRKIVAQAVSAIAQSETVRNENGVAFSWDAVNDKNRAATVEDTTAGTVNLELDENASQVRDLRLHGEWDALEKKFGNWRTPIPQPGIGSGASEGFRTFGGYVNLLSSQWNLANAPLCKAAKSIGYFRLGIGSALVALREKLNALDDNLTARQMLEQLRDVLDVEDAPGGGYAEKLGRGHVMAFRVLLEKRAAEEENKID